MAKATLDLRNASDIDSDKHGDREVKIANAREAVERTENARITTLRKQAAEREQNTVIARTR